eukprot:634401-Prymnesium_polylepis.1
MSDVTLGSVLETIRSGLGARSCSATRRGGAPSIASHSYNSHPRCRRNARQAPLPCCGRACYGSYGAV